MEKLRRMGNINERRSEGEGAEGRLVGEATDELHARLRKDIEDFNQVCEEREHTDIGDLWTLVGDIWVALGGVAGTLFDQPRDEE